MTGSLDKAAPYRPSPDAMESRLGDETVILHLGSGTYFGLDAVGTVLWEVIVARQSATPDELCAFVRASFADAPDTMEAEVTEFLAQLAEHNLILRV